MALAANRRPIVGVEHLDVLDAGHERLVARAVGEDAEDLADRGVADGVDLGRDAAGRRPGDPRPQAVGVGHPHAAALLRRERSVGLRLDVLEEGRRARPERPVGEALLPADPGTAVRVLAQHGPAPVALLDRGGDRVVAHAGVDPHRQSAGVGQPGVDRERSRSGPGPAPRRPGRGRRPRRGRGADRRSTRWPRPARRRSVAGRGSSPAGTPSRRARPRAARPASGARPRRADRRPRTRRGRGPHGWPTARGGRGPRCWRDGPVPHARGRRPSASGPIGRCPSRAPPATPPAPAPHGPRPAAPDPAASVGASVRSTWRSAIAAWARWRWASVSPGMATWSGSRRMRRVNGSARVSRNTSDPANADPPVADADGLHPAVTVTPRRASRCDR